MRCLPAHHFTVAKAVSWRAAIDEDPVYQRGGDAWTLQQQQRFIDSLLNGYDVPKIYLHDLRGRHPTKVYAIVDGKQRLTAIWSYLADGFPLADGVRLEAPPPEFERQGVEASDGPRRFSELQPAWRRRLLETYLSVVLIRDADEAAIDELFARLNSGVPLTAAERRNASGGDLAALVRELAARPDLAELLPFRDERGSHREVAAAVLALAAIEAGVSKAPAVLDDGVLDDLVRGHRRLDPAIRATLEAGVERRLASAGRAFDRDDQRLATPRQAIAALHAAYLAESGDVDAPAGPADAGSGGVTLRSGRATDQVGAAQRSKRTG
jgi:hypothetical protein